MKNPHVTVIVPVYNVSEYIEKCARSIFEQTLNNLEIIFVDDCSSDNSVKIIQETLKKYPVRIPLTRIIRMQSNGGLAAARGQGIVEATGDFIIHCDGDDWVDTNLYESMYNKAIEAGADIVVCNYVEEFLNKQSLHEFNFALKSPKELLKKWYSNTTHMSCCNKLIKKSIYYNNNILPWVGLNMWEDNGLMARIFYHSSRIENILGPVYHYNRTNTRAMTSGYGIKQVEQMIDVATNLTKFFNEKKDAKDFKKTVMAFQFLARINLVTDSFANLRRYNNTFKGSEAIIPYLDKYAFSAKGRFRFYMVRYHLSWLFVLMFKVKNLWHRMI